MSGLLSKSSSLIAFVRVVETGSFSAAARLAGSTPSSISKSISKLEAELNAVLFRRSTRTLSLTVEGQAFFDRVAPLLKAIDDSADAVRPTGIARGYLRVSMPSEIGRLLLPLIQTSFLNEQPDVSIDLTLTDHHVDLISEAYDVIFRVGQLSSSILKTRLLTRLDMLLVASPSFVEAFGLPTSLEKLRHFPFVRYQLDKRTLPITFFDGITVLPQGRIGVDSGSGLRLAAINGMGIAYLMRCAVQRELDSGELIQILEHERLPKMDLHALHAFGAITPVRVRLFSDFVKRELVKLTTR